MAHANLQLELLTPTGTALPLREGESQPRVSVEVTSVEAPGLLGRVGVLPDHVPFITPVKPGVVRFRDGVIERQIAVGAGFLEVTADGRVVVLTERAVDGSKVNKADVTAALKHCEARLGKEYGPIDAVDHAKLVDERGWLEAQLQAAAAG
ncbi:MAG: ATP synthase F1 subunit epsilon [Myxococcales bacterium]|nr:ATP synthase F1 subunit epsilon [Myxococcales bacterium]